MAVPDFSDCFLIGDDRSGANWDEVERRIEALGAVADRNILWGTAGRTWVGALASKTAGPMRVTETENFIALTMFTGELEEQFLTGIEKIYVSVMDYLGRAGISERLGKLAVLVFGSAEDYCDYIAQFSPEDSVTPMSGGMCIFEGYGHMALYEHEWGGLDSDFVHEVTHAYVSHLPLPTWINEAIAMRMETLVTGLPRFQLDRDLFARHQEYWNQETLTQFITGESWQIPGESFDLSYQLAEILWSKIELNLEATHDEIQNLLCQVSYEDGGEAALQEISGVGLDDLFRSFLGEI
jgi:hypothetical protein